jgi:hypothetical protein
VIGEALLAGQRSSPCGIMRRCWTKTPIYCFGRVGTTVSTFQADHARS